jgi:hypothetical protein
LYSVFFNEGGIGFITGSNVMLRSIDGGDTWDPIVDFPFEAPADWVRSIYFVNKNIGYACADIGRIYKTIDEGETWFRLSSITQEALFDIDFVDENNGIVCGFNGTILRTEDGGMNWIKMESPLGIENLYSIDLIDKSNGFICSHFGKILQLKMINSNIGPLPDKSISIYPNPTKDFLFFDVNDRSASLPVHVELLNATGQKLWSSDSFIQKNSIDLSMYPNGMYWLSVYHSDKPDIYFKQIIKQ